MKPSSTTLLPILLALLPLLAHAAKPASFCKCTCLKNSTIIPLGTHRSDTLMPRAPVLAAGNVDLGIVLAERDADQRTWQKRYAEQEPSGADGGGNEAEGEDEGQAGRKHTGTCADCNRALCVEYGLLACKDAEEKDIFATCFQRDSRKDEAIVFIFISATVGLLLWAGVRPWIGKWIDAAKERRSYAPVAEDVDAR